MTDNAVSHPLAQRIASLRLPGMLAAFLEQMARHDLGDMPFEDRLALLIDREISERRSRALQRRLKKAQLRHQDACFEDINLSRPRGLDRSLMLGLGDCALGPQCRQYPDHPARAARARVGSLARSPTKPALEAARPSTSACHGCSPSCGIAHGEGTIPKLYRDLGRIELLILDDWGLAPIDTARARDLLEILDDRIGRRSVVVTSQLPVADWHRQLNDPTLADAILDRLVHGAIRIELRGKSMRNDDAGAGTKA